MNRKGNIITKVFFSAMFLLAGLLLIPKITFAEDGSTPDLENVFCNDDSVTVLEPLSPIGTKDQCFARQSSIQIIERRDTEALMRVDITMQGNENLSGVADESPNDKDIKSYIAPTGSGHGTVDDSDYLGGWESIWDNDLESDSSNGILVYIGKKVGGLTPSETEVATLNRNLPGSWNQAEISDGAGINATADGVQGTNGVIKIHGYYGLNRDPSGRMILLGNNIKFTLPVIKGLAPDTVYYARMVFEGDYSFDQATTTVIRFSTPPAGTAPTSFTDSEIANLSQANTSTDVDAETGLPTCGVFGESTSIMGCVAQIIYYIIFKPTTWIMVLAGEIMDWGIGYSIDSASYPVTGHSFVTDGWRIMRDLANICFIFVLVYIAITTILGQKKEKMIGMVILVALVINFSLFVTKVVVDFGNITSRFFYNNISITNSQSNNQEITGTYGQKSISYGFAATFNPVKLFSGMTTQTKISSAGNTVGTGMTPGQFAGFFALFSVVGAIVNLVAAYVFFTLAWLFIARTAGIWLAMISAPLAFLSLAMPIDIGSKESAKYTNFKAWWENLTSLAVMPVVAMLMIFLILTFLKANIFANFGSEATTTGQFMSIIIPLGVLSFLLIQTKKIAESSAGDIGKQIGKLGSFIGGAAVGAVTGGAALAGRRVLGTAGSYLAKNADKTTRIGRNAALLGKRMETSTYDLKNTKLGQMGIKQSGLNTAVLGATTVKSGYKAYAEQQAKNREEYKESMKLSDKSDLVVKATEAKEKEDKAKEALEAAQKEKREAQTHFDTVMKQAQLGLADAEDLAEASKALSEKEDVLNKKKAEHTGVKRDHDKAKAEVERTNAKIVGSIANSVEAGGEKIERQLSDGNVIGGIGTATTAFKDIVIGSTQGRAATAEKFRKEALKAQESADKKQGKSDEDFKKQQEAEAKKYEADKAKREKKVEDFINKNTNNQQPAQPYTGTNIGFAPNNQGNPTNNAAGNTGNTGNNTGNSNTGNNAAGNNTANPSGTPGPTAAGNGNMGAQMRGAGPQMRNISFGSGAQANQGGAGRFQGMGGVDQINTTPGQINITNSKVNLNVSGAAVNTTEGARNQSYRGTSSGFKREEQPSTDNSRPIGFPIGQQSKPTTKTPDVGNVQAEVASKIGKDEAPAATISTPDVPEAPKKPEVKVKGFFDRSDEAVQKPETTTPEATIPEVEEAPLKPKTPDNK